MKMAKKLLAVAMVLTMVAAFAAIAFAASPTVDFSVGTYADGKATVTANFSDCVGLKSGSLEFAYPDGTVAKVTKKNGSDVKAIGDVDNSYNNEFNANENPVHYGFFFKETLWDSATWAAAEGADEKVNGESFQFASFDFTGAEGTVITVTGELKIGDDTIPVNKTFTIGNGPAPETTTAAPAPETTTAAPAPETTTAAPAPETTTAAPAPETTTAAPAPSGNVDKYGKTIIGYDPLNGKAIVGYDKNGNAIYSQDPNARRAVILDDGAGSSPVNGSTGTKAPATKDAKGGKAAAGTKTSAGIKTDGGQKTGDNGIIAIMAGVVALAGAAFVVTKKRK